MHLRKGLTVGVQVRRCLGLRLVRSIGGVTGAGTSHQGGAELHSFVAEESDAQVRKSFEVLGMGLIRQPLQSLPRHGFGFYVSEHAYLILRLMCGAKGFVELSQPRLWVNL